MDLPLDSTAGRTRVLVVGVDDLCGVYEAGTG